MATSSTVAVAAATDVAAANDMIVQQATRSKDHGENIRSVARQIGQSWPGLRDSLQRRQTTGSSLNEIGDASVQKFNRLISLLDQLTAEMKVSNKQTEPATHEDCVLPLERFLERDLEYAVPDFEVEAELQNGKHFAVAEKSVSPCASSSSLVADSALSTAVSDDTIVLDIDTISKTHTNRQQMDGATLRDLNEKLCRIVTSGQATKNIIVRATDLIDAGADVNARDEWCDGTVYDKLWSDCHSREDWLPATVLYGAVAARADCDVIRLLLNKGADINRRGGFNGTPLQAIVQTDEKDIVRLLLNRGADINAQAGGFRRKTLLVAAEYGTIGIVELLLERGAQVTEADSQNATALHAAAHKGHIGMIKLLLDRGAVIDAQKRDTDVTPLAEAVKMAHEAAVQILLARGADVTLLQPVLKTYADNPKRARLMNMLNEYGAEYTCLTPEVPRERTKPLPTYELVREGCARATFPEAILAQRFKEVETTEKSPGNGRPLPGYESKDVKSQASQTINTNRPRQTEETGSVGSSQTNLTAKTETKKRRKFWSRFSSQTTLHDNS